MKTIANVIKESSNYKSLADFIKESAKENFIYCKSSNDSRDIDVELDIKTSKNEMTITYITDDYCNMHILCNKIPNNIKTIIFTPNKIKDTYIFPQTDLYLHNFDSNKLKLKNADCTCFTSIYFKDKSNIDGEKFISNYNNKYIKSEINHQLIFQDSKIKNTTINDYKEIFISKGAELKNVKIENGCLSLNKDNVINKNLTALIKQYLKTNKGKIRIFPREKITYNENDYKELFSKMHEILDDKISLTKESFIAIEITIQHPKRDESFTNSFLISTDKIIKQEEY